MGMSLVHFVAFIFSKLYFIFCFQLLQFQPNLSYAYVQQIYVRSAVIPWTADMQLVDALRGPFEVIFELIESISNYQQHNNE